MVEELLGKLDPKTRELFENLEYYLYDFDEKVFPSCPTEVILNSSFPDEHKYGRTSAICYGKILSTIGDDSPAIQYAYYVDVTRMDTIIAEITDRDLCLSSADGEKKFTIYDRLVALAGHEVRHRVQHELPGHELLTPGFTMKVPALSLATSRFASYPQICCRNGKFNAREFDAMIIEELLLQVAQKSDGLREDTHELLTVKPTALHEILAKFEIA